MPRINLHGCSLDIYLSFLLTDILPNGALDPDDRFQSIHSFIYLYIYVCLWRMKAMNFKWSVGLKK